MRLLRDLNLERIELRRQLPVFGDSRQFVRIDGRRRFRHDASVAQLNRHYRIVGTYESCDVIQYT